MLFNHSLKRELAELKIKLSNAQGDVIMMLSEKNRLEQELIDMNNKILALEHERTSLLNRTVNLETSLNELKTEIKNVLENH